MQSSAKRVYQFVTRINPSECDSRVHLPRLAQLVPQLQPNPKHVVVLGAPIFIADKGSPDAHFSMREGRVPSDGMLFQSPDQSIYSVIGREDKLAGQYWHLGWKGEFFVDDTHRQKTLRMWHCYLNSMGASLVTAQDSTNAALLAARNNLKKPLLSELPDRNAPACMLKLIKVGSEMTTRWNVESVSKANAPETRDQEHSNQQVTGTTLSKVAVTQAASNQAVDVSKSILVAKLIFDEDVESSPINSHLQRLGYSVHELRYPLPNAVEFEALLKNHSQLWLWSSSHADRLPQAHLNAICDRWTSGNLNLCLLADNAPFNVEANLILGKLTPGTKLDGDFKAKTFLKAFNLETGIGFKPQHPLFNNLDRLWEGNTVGQLVGYEDNKFEPACFGSEQELLIASLQAPNQGKLVIDAGFTRYYKRYWLPETERLVTNFATYLQANRQPAKLAMMKQ